MSTILVIEDDRQFCRALRLALEEDGHTVTEAGDGREGLKSFEAHPADLVVTDLIMPEMEGVETIRALRKINPTLKIIAITGGGRGAPDNYLAIAKKFGAAQVFAKPFEIRTLCAAVKAML
jgi:DNA-binding response OmpR family regulator